MSSLEGRSLRACEAAATGQLAHARGCGVRARGCDARARPSVPVAAPDSTPRGCGARGCLPGGLCPRGSGARAAAACQCVCTPAPAAASSDAARPTARVRRPRVSSHGFLVKSLHVGPSGRART
ncbi:hypothetical protein ZWY2020_012663 [Hordeum vulgare]|nr:hypothetical protein ZWY2020_012663 [Hordeum vulgare]